jgi:hypoxanthine-guanine phosphoribosyltransferase
MAHMDVDVIMILKWTITRYVLGHGMDTPVLWRQAPVAGSWEQGNESSGSVKGGFLV